jgi:hypothetical protein
MSATDISRFIFQPNKRYSSVRMQQGRVILDSDWNESEHLDDEELRRTLLDVICTKGTSNDGFRISNVRNADVKVSNGSTVATYDFDFQNGSFYIGGLRFETAANPTPEHFLGQQDFLQIDEDAANFPVRPDNLQQGAERFDLVYLQGWEQCVSTVEDSELRERALGGPDTSVRVRRMRRVKVLTDVPGICGAAFDELKQKLNAAMTRDHELVSKARLTVVPNPGDITDDPCKPAVPGGYLGADNQTIRVQLTAPNRLIWGYDNAAPFYRVQVQNIPNAPTGVDGTRRQIKFLTLPRDQAAQPLAGQAVEIISWGALLPNQEKVAEFQGQFLTVETSFDPEEHTLTVTQAVSQDLVQWLADHPQFENARDDPDQRQYVYLRLWAGGSGNAAAPDFGFTPGTPVPLQGTGLSVTFSDAGLTGDFWIIAARPSTPTLVVPWELLDSAPPAGPRYFFAPLALIHWSRSATALSNSVDDCRERFRPLCNDRGCCTITVGDGICAHGDFDSIEDAIAALPDEGGEVCLLPGLHRTNATIALRRNVTIKGCGAQTQVIPRDSNLAGPIFHVVDSQRVQLYAMDMITLNGIAFFLEGSKPDSSRDIQIFDNRIVAGVSAIVVSQTVDLHIHDNRIRMLDKDGAGFAIQVLTEDTIIDHNDLGVVPAEVTPPPAQPPGDPNPTDPCADPVLLNRVRFLRAFMDHIFGIVIVVFPTVPFKALGGIQIAAASDRVKVLDNIIKGGAGNGILLGGNVQPPSRPIEIAVPAPTIESTGDRIQGFVLRADGTGVAGIGMSFTRKDGNVQAVMTGSGGFFTAPATPGVYAVGLASPDFTVAKIAAADDSEFGRLHRLTLANVGTPAADDTLAFLYEIQIDRNEISLMGLCGIGYPFVPPPQVILTLSTPSLSSVNTRAAASVLAELGNPVSTLGIHRNHIHDCLQTLFDAALRDESTQRGFGGISLGFCIDATISSNRIERNGRLHLSPACGIFIKFAEHMIICNNQISDNGALTAVATHGPDPGIRGGIVVSASAFGIPQVSFTNAAGAAKLDDGRHAGRIHDNAVYQPAGQALRLLTLGPASVCTNRFVSDLNGPDTTDRLAGVVLMITAGGADPLPTGVTLFNDNQSHLGANASTLTAQLIWTNDDLGFDANQSVALTKGIIVTDPFSLFVNTLLVGRTMRAEDSRFKEPVVLRDPSVKWSLITLTSLLNNTNDNQGDHCIVAVNTAVGRPAHVTGNQVVDATLCPTLNPRAAAALTTFNVTSAIRS